VRPTDDGGPMRSLSYRCDKLAATGFTLIEQIDREIDDTIRLCVHAFSK
jgi:hypothetical protein